MKSSEAKMFFLKKDSYFNLELPEYFKLDNILNQVITHIGTNTDFNSYKIDKPRNFETINYKMICNKDGKYGWRPFEIIHPFIYVEMVNILTEENNWKVIKQRFKDFSKNKNISCCSIPIESTSKKYDKRASILSWWSQFEQKSINYSLKYSYIAVTDITNCYASIYTHSIPWAIHTKEYAKNNRQENNIGNFLDKRMQDLSYGQTNGIPQGSAFTDFIAEIVLGYADELLTERIKEIKNYKILRYRDDYRIFAEEKNDVEKILKELTEVLSSLGLKLNVQKTFVSSDIISSSIKADKLYCIGNNNESINLENELLLIRNVGINYPNSGSLYKLLINLYKNKVSKYNKKINSLAQCISIIIDIMYNNPRTYNVCVAILSKLLEPLKPEKRLKIVESILEKFKKLPNTDYLNIWLQRLTIIDDRNRIYSTRLCQKLYQQNYIWESSWLSFNIDETKIIDEEVIKSISYVIPNDVIDIFDVNYN